MSDEQIAALSDSELTEIIKRLAEEAELRLMQHAGDA